MLLLKFKTETLVFQSMRLFMKKIITIIIKYYFYVNLIFDFVKQINTVINIELLLFQF